MTPGVEVRARLAAARTFLFVPGDRPNRFVKAAESGTDLVVLDLEDAVAPDDKQRARTNVAAYLGDFTRPAVVRVNALGTSWCERDLAMLAELPGLVAVMLPKTESATDVRAAHEDSGRRPVLALVETARGIQRSGDIAARSEVARLAVGAVDLALDLGCEESWEALQVARSLVVLASRAAGLDSPVDGVTTSWEDAQAVFDDVRRARALGFGAKLCIHPRQVRVVHEALAPSAAEITWAREVLATATTVGASAVRGEMVDRPVLERARRMLALADFPPPDPTHGGSTP